MKRFTIILLTLALLLGTASARDTGLVYHEIQVVDERGEKVTTISSVSIYAPDTTTNAVVYSDRALQNTMTVPITADSNNTTLSDGFFSWYGPDGYDFSITDGSNIATNANHRTRTASEGTLVFPSYLTAISSTDYNDTETITMGDGSDWVIQGGLVADRLTFTPATDGADFWVGSTSKVSDFQVFGATTDYDLNWDASLNQLAFRDGVKLAIGGAAEGDAGDFTMYHTADSSILTITAASADETVHFGNGTTATDVLFQNTTVAGADVWWDDSEEEWNFGGASTLGVDVKFWGTTASTFMLWDESDDELEFDLADLKIHEGSQIEFYHVDTVDWTMDVATGDRIKFTPALSDDTASIHIGDATYTGDLALFGKSASTVLFDASADRVIFGTYDIEVEDTANLIIGSDDEFAIDNSSETLRVIPSDATDDFAFHFGDADYTMDVIMYCSQAGETFTWDAGADSLTVVGDLLLVTATGTTVPIRLDATGTVASGNAIEIETTSGPIQILADGSGTGDITLDAEGLVSIVAAEAAVNAFKVDATGAAIAGNAIVLETTEGGIQLLSDGDTEGDIDIDCEDDMTLTAAGDFTLAVTGTTTLPNDVLLKATVELTAADMNTLESSPKEILPSPAGTDLTYEFVSAILALDYGGTAWTEDSAPDDLCFRYTDGSGAILSMLIDATGFATATADTIVFVAPVADIIAGTTAAIGIAESASTDQSIVLDNTGTNWTGSGNSIVQVIIYYRIHTTTELGL